MIQTYARLRMYHIFLPKKLIEFKFEGSKSINRK